jgi:3-deoxy-7-phosphoheptulonate synthase
MIENTNIIAMTSLTAPSELKRDLPGSAMVYDTVRRGRDEALDILAGRDKRLLVIAGPCSIHDEVLALDYAQRLNGLRQRYADRLAIQMRVYFDKPRTTVGWRGYLNDPHLNNSNNMIEGLRMTRQLLLKINARGLPAATEVLDPFVPQYLSDTIAWGAIGARTTESQTHRAMASGLSFPVGFKNGMDGNVQIAIDAIVSASRPHTFLGIGDDGKATVVYTKGNSGAHVVLRGSRSAPNYASEDVAAARALHAKAGVPAALVVDCSHHNSGYKHEQQAVVWRDVLAQRSAGEGALVGLMIESNINPGKQPFPSDVSQMRYGVSLTDACIGWDETEALLAEAASSA